MASHNELARRTLTSTTCSHKWWETLKGSIFGEKPSIPALRGPSGSLVVSPAQKASLLDALFDGKQCREKFVTPLSCFPRPVCNSLAFRTSVLHCLLLDLDSYGGVDPLGVFPLFFKMVADIVAPKLSAIFQRLIRSGSFRVCWCSAKVAAISKGPPFIEKENYRPMSLIPILPKVFEKLISHRLSGFCERSGSFPAAQFAYWMVWAAPKLY